MLITDWIARAVLPTKIPPGPHVVGEQLTLPKYRYPLFIVALTVPSTVGEAVGAFVGFKVGFAVGLGLGGDGAGAPREYFSIVITMVIIGTSRI